MHLAGNALANSGAGLPLMQGEPDHSSGPVLPWPGWAATEDAARAVTHCMSLAVVLLDSIEGMGLIAV